MSHIDELLALAERPDDLSSHALQRLTLSLVAEQVKRSTDNTAGVDELGARVSNLEEYLALYPPVMWYLRHKPKETLGVAFLLISLAAVLGGQYGLGLAMRFLWQYLGVPVP